MAVAEQDLASLKAALLPAVAQDWEGISTEAQVGAVLMKGGQVQLRSLDVYKRQAYSGLIHDDAGDFKKRVDESLAKLQPSQPAPPAKPDSPAK